MKLQNKNAWLPETVEDLIIFCKSNGLFRSRAILREAHQIMMSEIILETYLEELNHAKGKIKHFDESLHRKDRMSPLTRGKGRYWRD